MTDPSRRRPQRLLLATLALSVAACAARRETLVVVVPEQDGRVGKVELASPEGVVTLNSAYAAARTGAGGPRTSVMTPEDFNVRFAALVDMRPEPPLSFTLHFLEASDELTPESIAKLPGILAELRRRKIAEVTVVGHTDRVGKLDYNDRLSLQRADRVVGELIAIGIPKLTIVAAGRGEREPLVATDDEVAEPRNRRVEVSVR
jgi:outer membrane protein OmpA-like peptidoglycan-associated protein